MDPTFGKKNAELRKGNLMIQFDLVQRMDVMDKAMSKCRRGTSLILA